MNECLRKSSRLSTTFNYTELKTVRFFWLQWFQCTSWLRLINISLLPPIAIWRHWVDNADVPSWASIYFYQDGFDSPALYNDGNETPVLHTGLPFPFIFHCEFAWKLSWDLHFPSWPRQWYQWNLRIAQLLERWSTKEQRHQKKRKGHIYQMVYHSENP